MSSKKDPWATLGLSPGADTDTVKRVWRELAKAVHPDFNPSADAAQRFMELQKAKDAILSGHADFASAQAQRLRREWQPGNTSHSGFANWHSSQTFKRRTALMFSAACFIAGCGLFAGAILTYKVMMDEYSYTRPDKVEERLRGYNPQRERLLERIVLERAELAARRRQQQGSNSSHNDSPP